MRKDGAELSEEDFDKILKSGYVAENYRKMDIDEKKGFDSLYFMELKISADELKTQVAKMMQDPAFACTEPVQALCSNVQLYFQSVLLLLLLPC